ncbi:hypothetical protein AB1Y20_015076 [Prymnesium parvum]|uniref:Uncharacterized protein n=1 Tax=Prymnesium parvum TaxID=97485 RepID=A0AB34JZI8_PRYPA
MAAAAARRRCRRTAAVVQAAARGWGTLRPPGVLLLLLVLLPVSPSSLRSAVPPSGFCASVKSMRAPSRLHARPVCRPHSFWNADPFCARRACVLRPSLSAPMVSASSSCCLALLHPLRSSWNADLLCTPSVRSASAAVCASSLRVVLSVSHDGTPASSCLAPSSLPSAPLRLLAALDLSVAHTASGTPTPSVHAKRVFCVRCCPRQLSEHRAASLGRCQLSGQSVPLGRS